MRRRRSPRGLTLSIMLEQAGVPEQTWAAFTLIAN
jgi:hypothetical protein